MDWARGGCLSKALLDCLAGGPNLGLNLYERYMNETTLIDGDLSFTGLSRFGLVNRDLLKDLQYRFENPELEPAHWSIFSECDVNRVAAMLDLQIVMFAYEPTASERISPSSADADYWFDKVSEASTSRRFWLWHDSRAAAQLRRASPELRVFVVTPEMLFCVDPLRVDELDARAHVWFSDLRGPADDVCLSVESFDDDYLATVDALLGLEADEEKEEEDYEAVTSLRDIFLSDRHALYKRWSAAASCVVLLSYTRRSGSVLSSKNRDLGRPAQLKFVCMAITSELSSEDSRRDFADHAVPDAAVICFYGPKRACVLQDPFRSTVLMRHLDTRGLSQRLLNRSDLSGVPKRLSQEAVEEARKKHEDKKRKKRTFCFRERKKICRCRTCRSKAYAQNMAPAGPDRLCTVPYTLTDLLQLLNAYDSDAKNLISRMVQLSTASMDIESQTQAVDLEGPRPGPLVEYPMFGGPTLEGHVVKTQRPIMIGHTDALSRERGERWHDVVKDDSPEAVYAMFARYWLRVCYLASAACAEKKRISQSIRSLAGRYREAYQAFSQAWIQCSEIERDHHRSCRIAELHQMHLSGSLDQNAYREMLEEADASYLNSDDWSMPESKALEAAFKNSLPGLLDSRLDALISRYTIFSFYG